MLRINEESFYQGVRHAAFFHGVLTEDSRYNLEKDVVNGELVPLRGGADQVMEDQQTKVAQPDQSIEII